MPDPRSERTYVLMGVYVNSPIVSIVLYPMLYLHYKSSMSNPEVF